MLRRREAAMGIAETKARRFRRQLIWKHMLGVAAGVALASYGAYLADCQDWGLFSCFVVSVVGALVIYWRDRWTLTTYMWAEDIGLGGDRSVGDGDGGDSGGGGGGDWYTDDTCAKQGGRVSWREQGECRS